MRHIYLTAVTTVIALCGVTVEAQQMQWPPTDYFVQCLVDDVPEMLEAYHPETGRFGTEPWVCGDQNRIWPLAMAWAYEHPDNPYYHSDEVLEAIGGGGVALVEAQDEQGRWRFDKKDGSYWGQIHMPWTYSRWIRAYDLVGDALPADVRATWEEGLTLGFGEIAEAYPGSGVHNIPTHRAMALYIAGQCFGNEEWMERARQFMPKVIEEQDPTGFWSEHSGPVVGYNFVYIDALGVYYWYSRDPRVLDALERAAHFHASVLWPDGSYTAAIDERQIYHSGVRVGDVGFAHTPEGRGYVLAQLDRYGADESKLIGADAAATFLRCSTDGEVVMPDEIGEDGVVVLGEDDALIRTGDDWSWALSGYAAEVSDSRWIQDRHNLVDIYHDELGLVAGGGNTKLQPYWCTFTLGDPSLLSHTPGDESPDFTPDIDLAWVPDEGAVQRDGNMTRLGVSMVPNTPPEYEVLVSQGFEDTGEGDLPADWSVAYGSEEQMRVTQHEAHGGDAALALSDRDEAGSQGLRSPKMPAQPGTTYYAEAWWLAAEDNNAAIYLEFWDEQERIEDGVAAFGCSGTGEWARVRGSLTAPEGTVAVTVLVYSGNATVAEGHFDDVVLGRILPQQPEEAVECSVQARTDGDRMLLTYHAEPGRRVEGHLPLMMRGAKLQLATGETMRLHDEPVQVTSEQAGGAFVYSDLRVTLPAGTSLRWPARHHNPYTKDGSSSLGHAKLVLVMPFEDTAQYTIALEHRPPEPFDGLAFEARDLPAEVAEGCYTKRLDGLGSQFLGARQVGDWIRFTLPEVEPGRYELIGDFVLAHSYGIVEVLVDGERVGDEFDGYWVGVDDSGEQFSFGPVELGAGEHEITVRVTGKNEEATAHFISVKRWLLRPLD